MSRRRYTHGSYRRIRTTQERRLSFACEAQYVRPSRNFMNLPNSWDDKAVHGDTSWKGIRKKQWRAEGRGKQHEIVLDTNDKNRWRWLAEYAVRDYFQKYDIPYRIERLTEQYTFQRELTKWVETYTIPEYIYKYNWDKDENGKRTFKKVLKHQIGWKTVGRWVGSGEYKTYTSTKTIGYKITWWSDKDIGMEYILGRVHY